MGARRPRKRDAGPGVERAPFLAEIGPTAAATAEMGPL